MINESESEFISRLEESVWTSCNVNEFVNTAAAGLDLLIRSVAGRKNNTELPPKIKGWLLLVESTKQMGDLTRTLFEVK